MLFEASLRSWVWTVPMIVLLMIESVPPRRDAIEIAA